MKKLITCALALLLAFTAVIPTSAVIVPYESYNYDYWENIVFTPAPYIPGRNISGVMLGVGAFLRPMDISKGPDGLIYIADTGNNRIVVINEAMTEAVGVIESFNNNGRSDTFNQPHGVAVSQDNLLYVADSLNERVVVLDGSNDEKHAVRIISDPKSEMLGESFAFTPLKLAVDFAGRVYVVPRGSVQGIMVFSSEGDFTGFFGTINVQITPWQIFWRAISTRAERSRQRLFIATEFTGICVDPRGFIFASNIDPAGEQAVRRLNPNGEDVIRLGENGNLGGDLQNDDPVMPYGGPSVIVDVVYREKGIYSLLDSKRGRIFTYDHEGNLLYIFGGLGSQVGTFRQPAAIEYLGGRIAVLDAARNEIITFDETLYGRLINEAVGLRFDGDEAQAVEKWRRVLLLNENLELANVGIGKAYLTSGDNLNAMKYLELGKNRTYYSIAYKRYRNEILKENLPYVFTGIILLPVTYLALKNILKRRRERRSAADE